MDKCNNRIWQICSYNYYPAIQQIRWARFHAHCHILNQHKTLFHCFYYSNNATTEFWLLKDCGYSLEANKTSQTASWLNGRLVRQSQYSILGSTPLLLLQFAHLEDFSNRQNQLNIRQVHFILHYCFTLTF